MNNDNYKLGQQNTFGLDIYLFHQKEITNQRNFLKLICEKKKISAAAVKRMLKNTIPEYTGKNTKDGNLDELEKGNFKIASWLYIDFIENKKKLFRPEIRDAD